MDAPLGQPVHPIKQDTLIDADDRDDDDYGELEK